MELPKVVTLATDKRRNITFRLLAYRTLSDSEVRLYVRTWWANNKKKPKAGETVTIALTVGIAE